MARKLSDWLEAYMRYTHNTEPPVLYRKWVGMSVIAAALQRKCYMVWEENIFPNLFVVLVGPSGKCRKGTAMAPGYKMLEEVGITRSGDAVTREALIRLMARSWDSSPGTDGFEVIGHSSVTVFSKEFAVFLGHNNPDLLSALTDLYDCHSEWKYDTKTEELKDRIKNVYLNLIGATTPELLQSLLPADAIGGGLASRIIFVVEKDKAKIVRDPRPTPEMKKLWNLLIDDLHEIKAMAGEFTPSQEYLDKSMEWYEYSETNPPFEHRSLEAYLSRRMTHMRKLSMIMSASRSSDMILREEDFDRAVRLLEETEKRMPYAFEGVGSSRLARVQSQVMSYIARHKKVETSTLMARYKEDIYGTKEMAIILGILAEAGFIEMIRDREGRKYVLLKE